METKKQYKTVEEMRKIDIYAYSEGSFFGNNSNKELCLNVINGGIHKYPFLVPFLLTKTNTYTDVLGRRDISEDFPSCHYHFHSLSDQS